MKDDRNRAVHDDMVGCSTKDGLLLVSPSTVAHDNNVGTALDDLRHDGLADLLVYHHTGDVGDLVLTAGIPEVGGNRLGLINSLLRIHMKAINEEAASVQRRDNVEELHAVTLHVVILEVPVEGLLAGNASINGEEDQTGLTSRHVCACTAAKEKVTLKNVTGLYHTPAWRDTQRFGSIGTCDAQWLLKMAFGLHIHSR